MRLIQTDDDDDDSWSLWISSLLNHRFILFFRLLLTSTRVKLNARIRERQHVGGHRDESSVREFLSSQGNCQCPPYDKITNLVSRTERAESTGLLWLIFAAFRKLCARYARGEREKMIHLTRLLFSTGMLSVSGAVPMIYCLIVPRADWLVGRMHPMEIYICLHIREREMGWEKPIIERCEIRIAQWESNFLQAHRE